MGQVDQMVNHWYRHRHALEELLKAIPNEYLHYKPWDGAMELGELAQHVAASNYMFVSIVKTGEGQIKMPEIVDCNTLDDVLRLVQDYTEKTKAIYSSLTDAELELQYDSPYPNFHGPRKKILTIMTDHEIHHKGQLMLYARMVGVKELPFFV
ncbi:DinB family protein [Desmospora activa]|uniref:Putative damage-inducible protein DinB n=1 Tax=Desmospora activa DSM 45169 TaxID=1121389 RepID=A0A2T4ZDV6_9BACL|nr:DinB family protein [Desmospora activa]PTM60046.1 putative damage-inducible protein DinB [Desmospora activa DSM 45169]